MPIESFLAEVRRVRATGLGTSEQSFYPAVQALLAHTGRRCPTPCATVSNPAATFEGLPDNIIFEAASLVPVLPVEVKPAGTNLDTLAQSAQATNYATSWGGGRVLVTNLTEWAIVDVGTGGNQIVDRLAIVTGESDLDLATPAIQATPERFVQLLALGVAPRATLAKPQHLARLLAFHAQSMLDRVSAAGDEPLTPIRTEFGSALDADLDQEFFAPTLVQSLVYGLFSAWLQVDDPIGFRWQEAAYRLRVPVIADILHACLRPGFVRECNLLPQLDSIGQVLARVDRSDFEGAFDHGAIEYFYEPFLAEFDPSLRDELGVWYTPREIADYQVARVDHELRSSLSIEQGLADESVVVLDPAVGTGTYLSAVARRIFDHWQTQGESEAFAAQRVRQALTTRVVGFELLPAAFLICHINLSRVLEGLGAELGSTQRLKVFLTNSLTGWDDPPDPMTTLFPELAEELRAAANIKQHEIVLVILGNPPYHGFAGVGSEEEQLLVAPWSDPLFSEWGVRKRRLDDLYVRFWRMAVRRIAEMTGRGVVSFITNRKWLGGRSYPVMREGIVRDFDRILIDDLHGSARSDLHVDDESVFKTAIHGGIRVGTAVVTTVLTSREPESLAEVHRRDFVGSGVDKRQRLAALANAGDLIDDGYHTASPTRERWWKLTDDSGDDFPALDEYLPWFKSGVQPVRDWLVSDPIHDRLQERMKDYFDPELDWDALVARYPGVEKQQARYEPKSTRSDLLSGRLFADELLIRYLFRPLDGRWLYWETRKKLLNESRNDLVPYFLAETGSGLVPVTAQRSIVAAQTRRKGSARRLLVTSGVASFHAVDPDARVFPKLKPGSELAPDPAEYASAAAPEWINAVKAVCDVGDREAGDIVFYALVAVGHSPAWQATQDVESDAFVGLPIPADANLLVDAAALGARVADLWDPFAEVPGVTQGPLDPAYARIGNQTMNPTSNPTLLGSASAPGIRQGDRVHWDDQGEGWENVSDAIWQYAAGGFQVLPKWLSYRVGQKLTEIDRRTVTLLARRIAALISLESDADTIFASAAANPLLPIP